MFAKACVFAFLALFALQASAKPTDVAERNMQDALTTIVDKLTAIVQSAVQDSKVVIQELVKLWKELANQFLNEGKVHLEQFVQIIREHYKELVAQAQAIQTDVKECYEANKETIDALNQSYQTQMQQCVAGQVEAAEKLIAEFRAVVKEVSTEFRDVIEQVGMCEGDIPCYIGSAAQVWDFFKTLPARFGPLVQQAAALAQSAQSEVPQCVQGVVNTFKPQIVELQNTIAQCIQDKVSAQ